MRFTVPGEPHGKGRPKFSTIGGHVRARTPDKTVVYENLVRTMFQQAAHSRRFPDDAMLDLRVMAYYTIPASASKKRRAAMLAGEVRPTKKPDADNILKVVADSLNGIAYRDDAQIVDSQVRKFYSDRPRVEVIIQNAKEAQHEPE
ncbi:MAG: RusA family crossover junction endodeoxyribonuclease [Oscillospiraceae bacterium]|nr:RusA family crossover junction endodeoxyribonuclease [Oscillospiraceae bacterium]